MHLRSDTRVLKKHCVLNSHPIEVPKDERTLERRQVRVSRERPL